MVCDPIITDSDLKPGEQLVKLIDGLNSADLITLHVDGNDPILTSSEFQSMKKGVIILNSARGNLIEEAALIKALDSGKVASVWLDVFPEEPYSGKLTEYDSVLLTPHMSTYSVQCRKEMELAAVHNLLQDLSVI